MGIRDTLRSPHSAIINLYRYLFEVRGVRAKDHFRLLFAPLNYLIHLGVPGFMGYHIPGSDLVLVRTWDDHIFAIRPKTPDLEYTTLIPEHYELTRWFLPNAKGIVIDVGANVGGYTARACRQAEIVIAIEPQKDVFELLKFNTSINCKGKTKTILLNKAVGDRKGTTYLEVPKDERYTYAGGASLVRRYSKSIREHVEVDTLDNIIDCSIGLSNEINFVKIDIEGAEAIALKGMLHTLSRAKYIMIEISEGNEFIIRELIKLGFRLIDKRRRNYLFTRRTKVNE